MFHKKVPMNVSVFYLVVKNVVWSKTLGFCSVVLFKLLYEKK